MPRRRFKSLWIILALIALGTQVWKEVQRQQSAPVPRSGKATQVFEVLYGAHLLDAPNNDGDSFKITHQGRVHELRLYFADCPEKSPHAYNHDRLKEQGRYFGGLNEAQTVSIGREAMAFTQQWLLNRPFTVYTKWQGVFNSGRHYAFVVFPDGEDLSAKLVREGLARLHTTGTTLPDGRSASAYEHELRQLEAEARAGFRGGWSR